MRRSNYKYKVYNGKIIKETLENSRIYLLIIFFVSGLIVGALTIRNADSLMASELRSIVDSYKLLRMGQGILSNFLSSLLINILFIGSSTFLGFSLIGYPFIIWIPLVRGMGIGMVCGYLYSVYKFSGLGYALLTIYPGAALAALFLIISCNYSCEYSKNAYFKSVGGKGQFERGETKIFLLRQVLCVGFCSIASITDALASKLFSGFFTL